MRTGLTVLGLAFAVPMVVLGLFWRDALEGMVNLQFDYVERGDAIVTLTHARASRAVGELARLPGVLAAEGQRIVAARLRAGHRTYRLGLTGVGESAELRVPRDASLKPIAIPQDGLALSRRLAGRLAVKTGDLVQVEILEGARPTFLLPVAALVEDVIGMNAYAQNDVLNRLMREDDLISHVALRVDPALAPDLWRALEVRPRVAATGVKSVWLRVFHELGSCRNGSTSLVELHASDSRFSRLKPRYPRRGPSQGFDPTYFVGCSSRMACPSGSRTSAARAPPRSTASGEMKGVCACLSFATIPSRSSTAKSSAT